MMGKDVIIACDFAGAAETFAFLDRFTGRKPFVKIGMELFTPKVPRPWCTGDQGARTQDLPGPEAP